MDVPDDLRRLIETALDAVRRDEDHDLALGYRQALLWKFGPYRFAPDNTDASGHRRRVNLAILSVRRVLPMWESSWPQDRTPHRILERSEEIMEGAPDREAVQGEFEEYWEYIEELLNETYDIAAVVGLAADIALALALTDGFTDGYEIDYDRLDNDNFMDNNTEFYAAAAYAGGPVNGIDGAPDSDKSRRREFWEWWLLEAVPEAWNSVAR